MRRLFVCGVWRVALVAAYLTICVSNPEVAGRDFVYVIVIVVGLAAVTYDVIERHHRA